MQLKRLYDTSDPKAPKIVGVSVKHTGVKPAQTFSSRLVSRAVAEGWMSLGKGRLVLHAKEGDLVYTVLRASGLYCCHCGAMLPNEHDARAHVAATHGAKKSPDANNPSGYRAVDGYETTLDEAAHKKFCAARPFQGLVGAKEG